MLTSRQEKLRQDNHELLLQVTADEARRLSGKIEDLEAKFAQWDERSLYNVVMEAAAQSEDVTDAQRVKRIGMILARAIVVGPAAPSERAIELMRIARMLTDQDVEALSQHYPAQFSLLGQPGALPDIDAVNDAWRSSKPKIPGVLEADLLDILLKLQGQGLIRSVERRNSKLGPNEQPFALGNKGADFVRWALGFKE
jgi:hypothetical protein